MHQLVYITVVLASFGFSVKGYRFYKSEHTVSNGGPWGTWGGREMCPNGYYAAGFSLKVSVLCSSWFKKADTDSGSSPSLYNRVARYVAPDLVRFECSGDVRNLVGEGTSWGEWGGWSKYCRGKGICGIQTKLEGSQGSGDDTALNDVKFFCCD
ncbi:hypothetical protein SRHO_G00234930 [Serrasalmus rhombeus]